MRIDHSDGGNRHNLVARVEQLLGLCDTLEARLQAAQIEWEKFVEAVVAGMATISAPSP